MFLPRFLPKLIVIVSVAAPAVWSQWDVNGPNASLFVNGAAASAVDSFHHNVIANPGAYVGLTFDSGANAFQGIIFLASTEDPDGVARIPTPIWGGSIDVGNGVASNIQIVADGIGSTVNPFLDGFFHTGHAVPGHPTNDLTLSLLVPTAYCDGHTAIQSILTDPANAPVFIDNTECADLRFDGGVAPKNLGLADDGLVTVPFAPGYSFPFHGVVYTEITISANGWVGFGPISAAAASINGQAFASGAPGIAVWLNDWDPTIGPNPGGVHFWQQGNYLSIFWGDPFNGFKRVRHISNPNLSVHMVLNMKLDFDPAFGPCFGPNPEAGEFSTYIDVDGSQLDTIFGTNGVTGHTPGGAAMAARGIPPFSSDILGSTSGFTSMTAVPVVEEHRHTLGSLPIVGWDGAGTPRAYNHFGAWRFNGFTAIPSPSTLPGEIYNYTTTPIAPAEQDVRPDTIFGLTTTPGSILTAIGKFDGFAGQGIIEFSAVGGGVVPATGISVSGGSGPVFAAEQVSFVVPAGVASGLMPMTFRFPAVGSRPAKVMTFPVFIPQPCVTVQPTVTLDDDAFAPIALNVPVTMYGTQHSQIVLNANGWIGTTNGSASFSFGMSDFFSGMGTPGNAAVAYCACDLNIGGHGSGATWTVQEDTCSGKVTVTAANQNYWGSGASAGTFVITFGVQGPDSVRMDFSGALNEVSMGGFHQPIVGLSDGIAQGFDYDIDMSVFAGLPPGFNSSLLPNGQVPMSLAFQTSSSTFGTTMTSAYLGGGVITILNLGGFLVIL